MPYCFVFTLLRFIFKRRIEIFRQFYIDIHLGLFWPED